ncbi:hypothetical protein LP419_40240 [Massilia sp. H-1]|nr:hypothetical protein LP419_40240 [Massilia sp. H-1]
MALAIAALCGSAQASVIQIETANATTAPLASANDYLAAVNAALLGASYATQFVSSYDAISHQGLFGGNTNFAFKSTIQFDVASAANFGFRAWRRLRPRRRHVPGRRRGRLQVERHVVGRAATPMPRNSSPAPASWRQAAIP